MMADVTTLVKLIRDKAASAGRYMVAIAGPPASGKSTLAQELAKTLAAEGEQTIVVPMDGFHFDDAVLNARGQRPRKGAPFTFDVLGFEVVLKRIRAGEPDVAIPVFDRGMELSRAAAAIVDAKARIILVEGNYLLLERPPWNRLRRLFDFTIFLNVPRDELERRLTRRWLEHGYDATYAKNWIATNDLPNMMEVIDHGSAADMTT